MFGQMLRLADVLVELGLLHQRRRLRQRAAQDQLPPGAVELVGEILERAQAGRVDRGHVAQPDDDDRLEVVDVVDDVRNLVGGAEQERSVDAEDGDVRRNVLVLQDVRRARPRRNPASLSKPSSSATPCG